MAGRGEVGHGQGQGHGHGLGQEQSDKQFSSIGAMDDGSKVFRKLCMRHGTQKTSEYSEVSSIRQK